MAVSLWYIETMKQKLQETKLKVKRYLELENVSILAGAGASFHLGAPVIRQASDMVSSEGDGENPTIEKSIKKAMGDYKADDKSLEVLLNCLKADRYVRQQKGEDIESIDESIRQIQEWLFDKCNTDNTVFPCDYQDDEHLKVNRYHYHEVLIKKLLQRPNNLRRANLFTTNYDMAFDYALDNLGVQYINGFIGVHNRRFWPEVYNYDIYYPGQSVSGKVHRAEKVLKYFKLHGSLSWVATKPSVWNVYGIEEMSLKSGFPGDKEKELVIYPCASKKSFALDLPYSEMFRQFSLAIQQPQSVLFCIGYSFYDEHINDIIKQALSIPSFTLFVINYSPTEENAQINKLIKLGDKRIIVLDQKDKKQSTFVNFIKEIMPDLYEEEENKIVSETMKNVYEQDGKETQQGENQQ